MTASAASGDRESPPKGAALYVHLPYCRSKCSYCDFNSWVWKEDDHGALIERLLVEAARRVSGLEPATVFLGGGTPTLLQAEELRRLLSGLDRITGFRESAREVTVEANPESVDGDRTSALLEGGASRLSIGVQSFRPEVLRLYERVHTPEDAIRAFQVARRAGFGRISLDLIFGHPEHAEDAWRQDLDRALGLGPEHLACYELAYEEGTGVTRLRDAGRWSPVEQEAALALWEIARVRCADAGLSHYEVSNFAKPGEECLHNLTYWRDEPYVGIGPGASSWTGATRLRNLDDPKSWQAAIDQGTLPYALVERPTPHQRVAEVLMVGLRLLEEGVTWRRLDAGSGLNCRSLLAEPIEALQKDGLLVLTPNGIGLSAHGRPLLDTVLLRLTAPLAV